MKVRILGNSIRFRLRQPEVTAFQEHKTLTEITEFGPAPTDQLRFCLEVTDNDRLSVRYERNTVKVGVPEHLAEEWTTTEMVGFDGTVDTGKGKTMNVLVEKDFVCLDRPEDENVGAYPNPNVVC